MSKYSPLRDHLLHQRYGEFEMTFREIEKILGFTLPSSAGRPQWWANTTGDSGHVQRDAWRVAGYDAFLIAGSERVKFRNKESGLRTQALTAQPVAPTILARTDLRVNPIPPPLTPVTAGKPPLHVGELIRAGFSHATAWILSSDGRPVLDKPLPKDVGVYAFTMGGTAVYVGLATMGLAKRIYFYARPGVTQRTSLRLNGIIRNELLAGSLIDIYVALPPDLEWNGLPVHGSAGLELGLIKKYQLSWNMRSSR
jgi:hypothetical protein